MPQIKQIKQSLKPTFPLLDFDDFFFSSSLSSSSSFSFRFLLLLVLSTFFFRADDVFLLDDFFALRSSSLSESDSLPLDSSRPPFLGRLFSLEAEVGVFLEDLLFNKITIIKWLAYSGVIGSYLLGRRRFWFML